MGDRIQFTAPANELKIANRELGAIAAIDGVGRLNLKMDSGRSLEVDPNKLPHLDYAYAMTSHSSQGQTANRVLIHVDTELAAKDLLNNRMAYVSVSRGAFDAQLFTNDRESCPRRSDTIFQSTARTYPRSALNRRLHRNRKSPRDRNKTVASVLESAFRTPACPG